MSALPPKADIALHRSECPLCAKSGLMQCSKKVYSITSSAATRSDATPDWGSDAVFLFSTSIAEFTPHSFEDDRKPSGSWAQLPFAQPYQTYVSTEPRFRKRKNGQFFAEKA